MITNKNQLKNKLKENKNNITIKRIYNLEKNNKIPEGSTATIEKVQSNAFTVKYNCLDREAWIYYDNIEVKDNKIIYYCYVTDYLKETAEKEARSKNIELIPVDPDDKINKNRCSNYNYIYKYVYIINEIIEK